MNSELNVHKSSICASCQDLIVTIVMDWQDEDQLILFRDDNDCESPFLDPSFQHGKITCFMRFLWFMREKINDFNNIEKNISIKE